MSICDWTDKYGDVCGEIARFSLNIKTDKDHQERKFCYEHWDAGIEKIKNKISGNVSIICSEINQKEEIPF